MRHILNRRRPSPAMAVAFIALLAALSGTAVALPGKNTVDSGDLKKNSVTSPDIAKGAVKTADIARNAVTGAKVRNNSLSGNDVNESTLGKVPSATNADNAANAANAANAVNAANANRAATAGAVDGRTPFLIKLGAGQTQTIASHGPISIVAECLSTGGNDIVRLLGASTQDGAVLLGADIRNGSAGNTLDPADPADDRELLRTQVADGTTTVTLNIDRGFVMAPDGRTLNVDGETTALGLNYAGADCITSGVVNTVG
jgi:hypothetical protein